MNGYPTIHLIHGFNERHTFKEGPSIKRLAPYLQGDYRVHTWDYGRANLIDVRTNNDNYSRMIAGSVEPDDILIGYSNAAAIMQIMLERFNVRSKEIHLLHPAIKSDWQAPEFVQKVYIYFNAFDKAVVAGKWWRRGSRTLPWNWFSEDSNQWGELGKTGYTGPYDSRVTQYDTADTKGLPIATGHGGLFKEGVYQDWGTLIMGLINNGAKQ